MHTMNNISYYGQCISIITGRLDPIELSKIEDVMRNEIFHSTLDWQTSDEFARGARLALSILLESGEISI